MPSWDARIDNAEVSSGEDPEACASFDQYAASDATESAWTNSSPLRDRRERHCSLPQASDRGARAAPSVGDRRFRIAIWKRKSRRLSTTRSHPRRGARSAHRIALLLRSRDAHRADSNAFPHCADTGTLAFTSPVATVRTLASRIPASAAPVRSCACFRPQAGARSLGAGRFLSSSRRRASRDRIGDAGVVRTRGATRARR
jgi:hypothetical protein